MSEVIIGYSSPREAWSAMVDKGERLKNIVKILNIRVGSLVNLADPTAINLLHKQLDEASGHVAKVNSTISAISHSLKKKAKKK